MQNGQQHAEMKSTKTEQSSLQDIADWLEKHDLRLVREIKENKINMRGGACPLTAQCLDELDKLMSEILELANRSSPNGSCDAGGGCLLGLRAYIKTRRKSNLLLATGLKLEAGKTKAFFKAGLRDRFTKANATAQTLIFLRVWAIVAQYADMQRKLS